MVDISNYLPRVSHFHKAGRAKNGKKGPERCRGAFERGDEEQELREIG